MLSKGAELVLKILIDLSKKSGEVELCDSCKGTSKNPLKKEVKKC